MSRAIGGYVRRCERVQGAIGHLVPDCPWCHVPYSAVHLGTAQHAMEYHPRYSLPPLRFEPFNVEPEDASGEVDPGVMDVVASFLCQHRTYPPT